MPKVLASKQLDFLNHGISLPMVIDGACNLYILIYIFIYSHLSRDPSRLSPTVANSKFCCCCCTSLKKNTNNLCCKKNNKKTTYFLIIFSLLISYVWQPSCTSAQFCEVSARVKTCLCARSLSLSHTHRENLAPW